MGSLCSVLGLHFRTLVSQTQKSNISLQFCIFIPILAYELVAHTGDAVLLSSVALIYSNKAITSCVLEDFA